MQNPVRPAEARDIPALLALLVQVNRVHSEGRPDLFKPVTKYSAEDLRAVIANPETPVFVYEDETLDLVPGTRLILYTDGVNEAERADKSLFGNDRLLAWAGSGLVRNTATSNKEIVDDLYKTVQQFTEGNIQNDDITIMSIIV